MIHSITSSSTPITPRQGDEVHLDPGVYYNRILPNVPEVKYKAMDDNVWLDGQNAYPGFVAGLLQGNGIHDITIEGIGFRNTGGIAQVGLSGDFGGATGVTFKDSYNIFVFGCKFSHIAASGVWASGCRNVQVKGCTLDDVCWIGSQEGISMFNVDGFAIGHNLLKNFRKSFRDQYGSGYHPKEAIDAKVGCKNGKIYFNKAYGPRNGMYIDASGKVSENIEVFGNEVYDCEEVGLAFNGEGGGTLKNINIHHNKSLRAGYHGFVLNFEGALYDGVTLKNNQISGNKEMAMQITAKASAIRNLIIAQNDFGSTASGKILNFPNLDGCRGEAHIDLTPWTWSDASLNGLDPDAGQSTTPGGAGDTGSSSGSSDPSDYTPATTSGFDTGTIVKIGLGVLGLVALAKAAEKKPEE